MPTFKEDLHLGHKVPLVETDDILNGGVSADNIAYGAVTTEKIANGAVKSNNIAPQAVSSGHIDNYAVTTEKIANGAVHTEQINDDAVTSAKIAEGAVTPNKIEDGAVTSSKINSGAVNYNKLADGAVTSSKIADEAVGADKIASGAVVASKIGDGVIYERHLHNDAVTTDKIHDGAVTTDKILDDSVNAYKIVDGAVTSRKLEDDAVIAAKIADGAVTENKINNFAVTEAKIAANAVTASKIQDGAVSEPCICSDAVTAEKIVDGAVTTAKIEDEAVGTAQLANGAVSAAKIVDDAITTDKIQNGAVTDAKIQDDAIGTNKIASGAVTSAKIDNGTVMGVHIADGAVTTDKLADGLITELTTIMDSVPTEDSVKPVSSGGLYDNVTMAGDIVGDPVDAWDPGEAEEYFEELQSQIANLNATVNATQLRIGAVQTDLVPTENSANFVTSGTIKHALDSLEDELQDEIDILDDKVDANKLDIEAKLTAEKNRAKQAEQNNARDISRKYTKPDGGIPKSDMSVNVQNSLSRADTALQTHQDISGKADSANIQAGTFKSVQVNSQGIVVAGSNPTTLSGYGITDAKIFNGAIILGSDSITPLTQHQDISGKADVSALNAHEADTVAHVTAEEKAGWDAKYDLPVSGIPKNQMATAVQTSLGKADTAYQKPGTGIPKSDLSTYVQTSLNKADVSAAQADLDIVEAKIPSAATSENQLADKAFVNSSISTATATFRGTFNLVNDLYLTTSATQQQIATALNNVISTKDNNDYSFVQIPTADATPNEIARIDRYKYNGEAWAFEYSLNNSSFTADQLAAINSGITTALVAAFNAKYDKPAGGIPSTDLAAAVQQILNTASLVGDKVGEVVIND